MRRLLVMMVCGIVVISCSTRRPHVPPGNDAGAGGTNGSSGGMGGADPGKFELEVNVVHWVRPYLYEPARGAYVRVDGRAAPVEVVADADGRAVTVLEADSGPWDVTVAEPGRGAVSIIAVTGAIEGSVHLGFDRNEPLPPTRELSGNVKGRAFEESWVRISAPGNRSSDLSGDTYFATLDVPDDPSVLRVLAAEFEPKEDGLPLNAVWLELEDTGGDLMADIELPSPPREVVETNLVLKTPTTGVVRGQGTTARRGFPTRVEDGYAYTVGSSSVEEIRSSGLFDWRVTAFDGEMAPTRVSTTLRDAAGESLIIANADPSSDEVVTVAPAEVLEATGTTLETLSLAWSARGHSHVGASLIGSPQAGSWFIYSYAGSELETRAWPKLPSAVTLAELGLDQGEFGVNVFATTQSAGPWNWSELADQRAVVHVQALEDGAGGAGGAGGAPGDG